jgi:hypothetical protein
VDPAQVAAVVKAAAVDATAIAEIAAVVVVLTQLLKWANIVSDDRAPLAVLGLTLVLILLYGFSTSTLHRDTIFGFVVAWIVGSSTAAGFFGFTRAMPAALTATKAPPPGAGSNPTGKMDEPSIVPPPS